MHSKSLKCFISSAYWSAYAYFQCWESKLIFISWNLKWLFEKNSIRAIIYLWMNTPKLYWPQRLILLFHIIKLFDVFCLKPCVTLRVTQRVTQIPKRTSESLYPVLFLGKRKYFTARLSNTTICLKTFLNTNISINWNTVYLEDLIKMETSAAILKASFRGFLRLNFETEFYHNATIIDRTTRRGFTKFTHHISSN